MQYKIMFILAMVIFGTIGLFVRHIPLPSSEIALIRGIIGSLFLLAIMVYSRRRLSGEVVRKNLLLLIISGGVLGFNWILLFQSYRYTTLSNAVLSYYFAPVFVMILSPFILKEKLSFKKMFCIAGAMAGMLIIMGNGGNNSGQYHHAAGIALGLSAAGCYAALMLLNKFIRGLDGLETTLIQLISASCVLLPYVILTEGAAIPVISGESAVWILTMGIVHTGLGFYLFFTSIQKMKGQTAAALSYTDPITAMAVSGFMLQESILVQQILGGALLLGATFISERLSESD
ncbi:MAG TPA: DMT family transporter [Spirochaetota bacterium]|nr:DMT family transporter [Spirochaetota bacterium]